MNRRTFLQAGAAAAAASLISPPVPAAESGGPAGAAATPARPNIIWIFGDQHRAQALGCAGDPNARTPNLDRLAADGVHFTDAVSGFPLCCPFRGSLIASRYPHVCVPGHEYPLPPGTPTIVGPLKEAGYHTGYFGKWHLDGWHEKDGRAAMHIVPPERRLGFDVWAGYDNNNLQYDSWVHGGEGPSAFHYRLPGYETDCLTDLLLKYIGDRAADAKTGREKPFFAVLSVQPPHNPYVAPPEYAAHFSPDKIQLRPNVPQVPRLLPQWRKDLAGMYAMIENLDFNVGRVRKLLAEAGLEKNTIILFFSDHGDMHGCHGQFRKTNPWEESTRIPLIVAGGAGANAVRRGGKSAALVNHVDIAPTTLGLAGLACPKWMQGTDYSPACRTDAKTAGAPDSAYLQNVIPTHHGDSVDRPYRGIITDDGWKYVCLEGQPWLLHNLKDDPYEQVNLALNFKGSKPRKRLQERLAAWISDTGDKFALPTG